MSFIREKNKFLSIFVMVGFHTLSEAAPGDRCDYLTATGNSEYPPFLWRKNLETNQLLGTNSLIINEISQRLGKKIELKHTGPWSRAQREVKSGRIDLMAGVFYTQPRSQYMDYIEPAFLETQSVVWTNASAPFDYQNQHSLEGKLGATVINNSFGQAFDSYAAEHLNIATVASIEQAFKMLLGKRVDYVLYEELPGEAYIQQIWNYLPFQIQKPAVSSEGLYLAFSQNSPCNSQALREELAGIMSNLTQEGFFEQIKLKGSAQWLLK
ncbi:MULTISPECIES: substrate-binding periplasmic protein [unclassified Marinomonas]|uniref:substrate-binding periplasmic protein n=1 Tax=unclassified Marinomonas TaxID=196814 RepID=UPI0007AFBD20|nr:MULTISPECIES: transporter substrate-binding domain-containing protein [unclassified Marinomonas]